MKTVNLKIKSFIPAKANESKTGKVVKLSETGLGKLECIVSGDRATMFRFTPGVNSKSNMVTISKGFDDVMRAVMDGSKHDEKPPAWLEPPLMAAKSTFLLTEGEYLYTGFYQVHCTEGNGMAKEFSVKIGNQKPVVFDSLGKATNFLGIW